MSEESHKLSEAPIEVQIAVDLIQLLEDNKIDNKIAIKALQIALTDFESKIQIND